MRFASAWAALHVALLPLPEAQDSPPAEPRELFTMQVENGNAPGTPLVPLVVREGDNAEVLASLFAQRYRLDAATRDELALAIVEHAKTKGFVRPLFVLEANVTDARVPLNVYKGDQPRVRTHTPRRLLAVLFLACG